MVVLFGNLGLCWGVVMLFVDIVGEYIDYD